MEKYWRSGGALLSTAAGTPSEGSSPNSKRLFASAINGGDSQLSEAVAESLKNMLLVMSTAGLFGVSSAGDGEDRFMRLTRDAVQPWLPHILDDLFPPLTTTTAPTTL
jgi:hypothetical protein